MLSAEDGWRVVRGLYEKLGIRHEGYLGGEVLLAPFDTALIARIPKTVFAFNPLFFVFESFEKLDATLDACLLPIAERPRAPVP